MRPVSKSLQEYTRGVAGGLLFSLPLLYTMEVWWAGFVAHPWRLALYVAATFALLLGYNRFLGLRRDSCFPEVVIDSIEELGLGLLIATLVLWLLGRVTADMAATEVVGKVVVEAMTVAIGVSVGTAQLGGGEGGDGDKGEAGAGAGGFGSQVIISLCGAVLFAANVAPTEEITLIAFEISPWRLLGLAALSLTLGALILYYSEFTGAREAVRFDSHHDVLVGTVVTYTVALLASAAILAFFGRFDGQAFAMCVAQTVVLGVAATMGASAGRLLLQ
ncbi:MAG TPA: TIGR02587 family membrane protein [Pyrinomonadaceae bacterium]|nr:TIGR02587 family membrane protein [Pyrinomonadaceae bacterium]